MFLDLYHYLKNKEKYILSCLFLVTIFLRIPGLILYGDTKLDHEWEILVNNLILHGKLVYQTFDGFLLPNLWMPPLYPYYIYFFTFFNLSDQNLVSLILSSQILMASISVILFYKINKIFFSEKISFYGSILFSIFPLHIYANIQIASISLQMFLTMLFLYFFFQIVKKQNLSSIIIFAFVSGLLILLRAEFRIILLLSLLYLFIFFKVPVKKLLLIFLISLLTISPYLIRNFLIFEKITIIETSGYNLWKGNHPIAMKQSIVEGLDFSKDRDLELKKKIDKIPIDKFYRINWNKTFFDDAIENIISEPIGYLIFYFKKIVSFLFININPHDPRYWNPFHYIPVLLIGLTSLIGLFLSGKKSSQFNYLIFLFFLNVLIFSSVSILPRYKLVIFPLQIIFTNVLLERINNKFFYQKEKS